MQSTIKGFFGNLMRGFIGIIVFGGLYAFSHVRNDVNSPPVDEWKPSEVPVLFERLCHQKLILKNLNQLFANGTSEDMKEAKRNLKDQMALTKASILKKQRYYQKFTGSAVDFSQCKEKILPHPITLDPETGQVVVPFNEPDED